MNPHRRVAFAVAVLVAAPAVSADAARTTLSVDLYARANPRAVALYAAAARRWEVADGQGPLARGRYAEGSIAATVSPARARLSIAGEWVPTAPVQLRVEYDADRFFGVYGVLARLPSADAAFRDAERLPASSGFGHRLLLEPVLRMRLGRVVLRSQTDVALLRIAGERGWYHEPEYDTVVAARDVVLDNQTAVLVDLWNAGRAAVLLAGPAYEITWARRADLARHRVGGVAWWVPADRALGLDRPHVFAYGGLNLADRNRRGEPFGLLGIGANLDLGAPHAR